MLKIYYNPESPNSFKTAIVLEELVIPHEKINTSFEHLESPEFKAKFPAATLPAIEDDRGPLTQSPAIALYLSAQNGGKLVPQNARALALMNQVLGIEAALVQPTFGEHGIFGEMGKAESERDARHIKRLLPLAQEIGVLLAALLDDQLYFAGEFSLADIQLYPGISKAVQHGVIQNPSENLVRWVKRMSERKSIRAAAEHFPMYRETAAISF